MSYKQNLIYAGNHRENIWNKVRKLSKIAQEQKTLITASAYFLTAIAKVFISGSKGTKFFFHPILPFS